MLILKNVTPVQFYPAQVGNSVDIVIEAQRIKEIGSGLAPRYPQARVMDLGGKYVSPGIVCAHNHFYSALARGILAEIPPSTDFVSILKNLWWRLDRALDKEAVYYSGLIAALEAIKCGTTAVIDHHASPSFIRGSLAELQKGFAQAGLRGILAYEITDRNGEAGLREGVEETLDYLASIDRADESRLWEAAVGGHAPFTLGDEALRLMAGAVEQSGRGIHLHVAEDGYDPAYCHHHYGKDLLQRLADFGLLNHHAILVHGVHLTDHDLDLLNQQDAFLVHNPRSNMNNAVGYMPKLHRVKNLALGTDGIGADMFEESKFAYFRNAEAGGLLGMDGIPQALQAGNQLLERYFGGKFGHIEAGYAADLVVYDYRPPTPLQPENLAGHLIFGFSSRDVETVIVNGKVVYEERRFPFAVEAIYQEAREQASRLWQQMNRIKP